jgi:hypothetical protein
LPKPRRVGEGKSGESQSDFFASGYFSFRR